MPVIVIGADTPVGHAVVPALDPRSGEIRVFVSDPEAGERFRRVAKVAVGDLSDGSHVGGAAIGAFCAVAVAAAAHDDRERYFAATPPAVFNQWADGLADAGVRRVILIGTAEDAADAAVLLEIAPEFAIVDSTGTPDEIAAEVSRLEQAPEL